MRLRIAAASLMGSLAVLTVGGVGVADEQPSHEHTVVEEVLAAPVRLPDGQMEIELD